MKNPLTHYSSSRWLAALVSLCVLGCLTIAAIPVAKSVATLSVLLFLMAVVTFLGLIASSVWALTKNPSGRGFIRFLFTIGGGAAAILTFGFLMLATMLGPEEDGFADNLTIPEGIQIAEPELEARHTVEASSGDGTDELQDSVRKALAEPGGDATEFTPEMPSLTKAATDHARTFREYVEASPDWHVFMEQGNWFASRRWSYQGEPRDTLHGYISEFGGDSGFQTRCLLCLDRKEWSRYSVQHVMEGKNTVQPRMTRGNDPFTRVGY